MNSIQFNEHHYRPASITDLAERLRDKSYNAGRRDGLAQLEQSVEAARAEGMLIGEASAQRGTFVCTLIGICIGIVFAIIGGPVVAGWLL